MLRSTRHPTNGPHRWSATSCVSLVSTGTHDGCSSLHTGATYALRDMIRAVLLCSKIWPMRTRTISPETASSANGAPNGRARKMTCTN